MPWLCQSGTRIQLFQCMRLKSDCDFKCNLADLYAVHSCSSLCYKLWKILAMCGRRVHQYYMLPVCHARVQQHRGRLLMSMYLVEAWNVLEQCCLRCVLSLAWYRHSWRLGGGQMATQSNLIHPSADLKLVVWI